MSGREVGPDGADAYHSDHPWEQVGHRLYIAPDRRTSLNWPPEPAYPADPHEAEQWDRLPVRVAAEPSWRRKYGYAHPKAPTPLPCKLGIHAWPTYIDAYTNAPAPVQCTRCGEARTR